MISQLLIESYNDVALPILKLVLVVYILKLLSIAYTIFSCFCQWRLFKKLGKPGWVAFIPVYREYHLALCSYNKFIFL